MSHDCMDRLLQYFACHASHGSDLPFKGKHLAMHACRGKSKGKQKKKKPKKKGKEGTLVNQTDEREEECSIHTTPTLSPAASFSGAEASAEKVGGLHASQLVARHLRGGHGGSQGEAGFQVDMAGEGGAGVLMELFPEEGFDDDDYDPELELEIMDFARRLNEDWYRAANFLAPCLHANLLTTVMHSNEVVSDVTLVLV